MYYSKKSPRIWIKEYGKGISMIMLSEIKVPMKKYGTM